MTILTKPEFTDKRKKPITVKGTKNKNKDISFNPVANPIFKKGLMKHLKPDDFIPNAFHFISHHITLPSFFLFFSNFKE